MFRKILIANRGEIALRIIWACKELGIKTVAVHSTADENSLHVRFANEAVCIGPPQNKDSYLSVQSVIAAAEITDADAIHPGYGFLAESAHFAEVCRECGLTFIGPEPDVIRSMGDKAEARRTMDRAGVPTIPGSDGVVATVEEAIEQAVPIGYPVLLKASAGGGGRGMRIVESADEMERHFMSASGESQNAFGNPDLYMEKYVLEPRHVEFQVLGDTHGNLVHLYERECSIQRRHQKLIEESPSTALDDDLRARMAATAIKAARAVDYTNAGTVEFLLDSRGEFFFIEMNTRIQVEHPVTEMVTGIDLIKEQIRIAAGEPISFTQDEVRIAACVIECRVNAEHSETFAPSPGRITTFHPPGGPGIRVDTAAYAEAVIPPYYDSMIAKVISRGNTRGEAILRMRRALESFVIEGIHTNIALQRRILADEDFVRGRISTAFMERFMDSGKKVRA
ncbi:MAG: acetyl-CoA carboxylase biotin carboxylase subunit [Acidobacteria bacterium]|uniref:Biotin carboxylase n=1 Tax=Candidatus Polarisedimenticola svalbardensis TaxID=2886004 RepID=A0A8J6Y6U8_9BACT|nr:acetyl-CoA carboxylase biotin carboxylase subunit [Candidatus Polarisedimenticola svalbardensis]